MYVLLLTNDPDSEINWFQLSIRLPFEAFFYFFYLLRHRNPSF